MASRKTAGKTQSKAAATDGDAMEAKVVALAEQLGWFLGTVRGKADGWLDSPAVRTEVARIRDGAADLMEQVNRASASAKQAAAGAIVTAIDAAPSVGASARKAVASAGTSAKQAVASASTSAKQMATSAGVSARKAVATAGTAARKAAGQTTQVTKKPVVVTVATKRSGGTVGAPGKKHRKPPPQVHIGRGMGEPSGKQMGQKSVKGDMRRGRQ